LLTFNPAPAVADSSALGRRIEVLSYGSPRLQRERGFVSIAATVMPAAIWVAAVHGSEAVLRTPAGSDRNKLADAAAALYSDMGSELRLIEVLATGWAQPAAVDFESKMTESRAAVVRLHDTKDFSHGRFLSAVDEPHPKLMLSVGGVTSYERALADAVATPGHLVHWDFNRGSSLGAFDALVELQYLAETVARASGKDLSRPSDIPTRGLRLYQWDGDLP